MGRIAEFDFGRRDELPEADREVFRSIQKAFAEKLSSELTSYLRKEFVISFQDLRQLPWSGYSDQFGDPGCLFLLKGQSLPGYGTLELTPSFVFTVLEILLGGTAQSGADPSRELTSLEKRLLAGFFRSVQRQLHESWTSNSPNFHIDSIVGSPAVVREICGSELMVLADHLVNVNGNEGYMRLAVPAGFIRQHGQDSGTVSDPEPNVRQGECADGILTRLQTGTVCAETFLDGAKIRLRDLAALEVGDVLDLDCPISSPISMHINGANIYSGRVVPLDGKRAFAIERMNTGVRPLVP